MKKVRKPFISSWHFIKSSFDNMLHSLFQNYAQLMNNPKLRIGVSFIISSLTVGSKTKTRYSANYPYSFQLATGFRHTTNKHIVFKRSREKKCIYPSYIS